MNCMKCGRELKEETVFCAKCQADMARYPVKPTVVVQLPAHTAAPAPRKRARRKHDLKPEEQIRRLRSALRWAYLLLAVTLAAFALTAFILLRFLERKPPEAPITTDPIGRNYTTQESNPAH